MDMDRIEMSQQERDVLKVMSAVLSGRRSQAEAARLLGRGVRQIRRIQRRLEQDGDAGVVHQLRGRQSNAAKTGEFQRQVLDVYRRNYCDFGPTLAAEKLAEPSCPNRTLRQFWPRMIYATWPMTTRYASPINCINCCRGRCRVSATARS